MEKRLILRNTFVETGEHQDHKTFVWVCVCVKIWSLNLLLAVHERVPLAHYLIAVSGKVAHTYVLSDPFFHKVEAESFSYARHAPMPEMVSSR